MIFGPCQETSYTAITLNPESNFTRREKNHSLFHWSALTSPDLLIRTWMSCKKAASMTTGMSMGLETCLILGQVSHNVLYSTKKAPDGYRWVKRFVWFLDRFHSVYSFRWDGFMWSGWRLTKRELTSRPDHLWPELWTKLERNAYLREKQKLPIEEFISLTLRTRNSMKPWRMLAGNWKPQWLPLCLARHARKVRKERSVARLMISRQNLHVSWKPVNP